jgi:C4-dicarboxylate transporter DctM subunit
VNLLEASLVLILALFALLGLGVYVGLALLLVGLLALALYTTAPLGPNLATALWTATSGWSLAALPLFVWMGEILYRSRLAQGLFQGLAPLLSRLPGGLLHVNVVASALFAAVIGSSAATTATVGRFTLPELLRRGYPKPLALGSLAGAGTLGFLIPPSVIMIVYGVMAEVSVARLFMAGVVPGVVLTLLFMLMVALLALRHRGSLPKEPSRPLGETLLGLLKVAPVLLLILMVLGSIYLGVATPTEAAAIGVVGALLLAALGRELSPSLLWESLLGAVRTTSMIGLILAGAGGAHPGHGLHGYPPGPGRLGGGGGDYAPGPHPRPQPGLHRPGLVPGRHLHRGPHHQRHPARGEGHRGGPLVVWGLSGDHGGIGPDYAPRGL